MLQDKFDMTPLILVDDSDMLLHALEQAYLAIFVSVCYCISIEYDQSEPFFYMNMYAFSVNPNLATLYYTVKMSF